MISPKKDLEQRLAAETVKSQEDVLKIVQDVTQDVTADLLRQVNKSQPGEAIVLLARIVAKHEVDQAMHDIGFGQLVAQLSAKAGS